MLLSNHLSHSTIISVTIHAFLFARHIIPKASTLFKPAALKARGCLYLLIIHIGSLCDPVALQQWCIVILAFSFFTPESSRVARLRSGTNFQNRPVSSQLYWLTGAYYAITAWIRAYEVKSANVKKYLYHHHFVNVPALQPLLLRQHYEPRRGAVDW